METEMNTFACKACEGNGVALKLDVEVLHHDTAHAAAVERGWGFDDNDAFCPECWEALRRNRRRAVNVN